jgi:hypothetical protein
MEHAQQLHAGISNARLEIFPGTGHAHHWEALDAFNAATTRWLDRQLTGPPEPVTLHRHRNHAMSSITFGCQTYTWQMSGPSQYDRLEHIIGVGAAAGFTGLEPEMVMLGRLSDPVRLKSALDAKRMKLGALCLVEDWLGIHRDRQGAR